MDAYRTAFVYVRERFAGVLKETDFGYTFQYENCLIKAHHKTN